MESLNLFARIERCATQGGRAILVGRGPSSRFLEPDSLGRDDLLIGYNLPEVQGRPVDIVYSTHAEERPDDHDHVLTLGDVRAFAPDRPLLRIGSIGFGLGELLTALDLLFSKKSEPLTLILVGFDFRAATSDDDILKSSRGMDNMQRQIDVNAQRDIFFKLKPLFSHLRIVHAGFDRESDADPRHVMSETAAPYEWDRSQVEVVAEITTNHFGDLDRLTRLIRGAAASGADSVKLQARDVASFYDAAALAAPYASPFGSTFADYRYALELSDGTIREAKALCERLGMTLFFSALDRPSFERLRSLGIDRIKLPSTISEHRDYLAYVAAQDIEELVISTGMTDEAYERFILETFTRQERLYLLHCVSSYPTSPSFTNIAVVRHYWRLAQQHPHIVPGYSSHDIGSFGCALAVAAGARMIEKHIKIGSTSWAHFDDTALDVEQEFPEFVRTIRAAIRTCGSETKTVQAAEHHKYRRSSGPHVG